MADCDKNTSPKNYIVTLIDIFGQKELLEEHRFLTETTDGRALLKTQDGLNRFCKINKETYGRVIELRENFKDALNTYSKFFLNNPSYNALSPEDQLVGQGIAKPMSYQFFSDTVVIYAPLSSEDELKMRYRIASTIFSCMEITLLNFSKGTFFRGGIEIGVGTEFPDEAGIYGLVLNDAYRLENEVAGYPRIVVGDKLRKLVQCKERKTVYSKFCNDINNRLDDFCNSSIIEDKDGRFIVDFLGKTFADLCPENLRCQTRDYVRKALIHISNQYTKSLSEDRPELSSKYELLKDYYFESLDNWGLQQTTIMQIKHNEKAGQDGQHYLTP